MAKQYSDEPQNQRCAIGNIEDKKGDELSSIIDLLRREFHKSLDLNYPMVESTFFDFDAPSQHSPKSECYDKEVKNNIPMKIGETKKRSLVEMEEVIVKNQKGKNKDLDLSLKLSPPAGKNIMAIMHDQPQDPIEMSSSSPPSSQRSCMSLDINSVDSSNVGGNMNNNKKNNNINVDEVSPSLILMGCTRCIIYVMVSEVDPKCPQCKSSILLDVFRGPPAKRSRKDN